MRLKTYLYTLFFISLCYMLAVSGSGCAQISAPTGGPKDSIPPRLVKAVPELNSVNFKNTKITLTFDEYIDVQDLSNNLLISPLPLANPVVDFKLRTVTVKLKDSLLPNTTYTINFGNAIRDNNEGNPYKNFTYVFSTGNNIDSLQFSGKVTLAETGKTDSTLTAMLYRNTDDSAVKKNRPNYLAKLNGDGVFTFTNLSPGTYKVYALKDGDGGKTYNAKTELFAFADTPVTISLVNTPVDLYAFVEEKRVEGATLLSRATAIIKKLLYTSSVATQNQDLQGDLEINFNKPLKKFNPSGIILTDTGFAPIPLASIVLDSSRKKISITAKWLEDRPYRLIINSAAIADSQGNSIAKNDTLRFVTKKEADYGNVVLHFSNIDLTKHPVLQFVVADEIKESYALTGNDWNKNLFKPGEYEIRILFDSNNNGKWDTGDFSKKIQPEKAVTLPQKLSIRANWDNERDIKL